MKKTTKNITDQNSTLDPLSDNNGSNPLIDGNDEFVLFPLDVQETNTITQNNATSQDDDFILFPLDINKSVSSSNNSGPIINKVPKKQFVTKPNPRPIIKPQPAPGPTTPTPIVTSPKNNKLRNLFWLIVICLSIYTCKNKENDESYSRFFSKTIHKFGNKFNKVKSIFVNENDFEEFKKSKQIIYSPYLEYIEDDSGEINEVKGDSIIIIEPTGKFRRAYYLPKGKPYKFKISKDEYSQSEKYATEKMELDIDQNSFQIPEAEYLERVSVFLLNTGFFSQEISVYKRDIRFEDSNDIEVKYMRNRIEDFKKNIILTKFISEPSLVDKTESNIIPKKDFKSNSIKTKIVKKRNSSIGISKSKNNSKRIKTLSTEITDDNNIYNTSSLEVKPEPPGGMAKFYKFVGNNYRTPEEEGLSGKVYVTFVVEKDGSLTDIKVLRDIGFGTGKEAIRVLKSCPKWNPGEQNGKKVRVLFSLPITIQSAE